MRYPNTSHLSKLEPQTANHSKSPLVSILYTYINFHCYHERTERENERTRKPDIHCKRARESGRVRAQDRERARRTLFCVFPFHFQLHYHRALPYRQRFSVSTGTKCRIARTEPNRTEPISVIVVHSALHFQVCSQTERVGSGCSIYTTSVLRRLIVTVN